MDRSDLFMRALLGVRKVVAKHPKLELAGPARAAPAEAHDLLDFATLLKAFLWRIELGSNELQGRNLVVAPHRRSSFGKLADCVQSPQWGSILTVFLHQSIREAWRELNACRMSKATFQMRPE